MKFGSLFIIDNDLTMLYCLEHEKIARNLSQYCEIRYENIAVEKRY